MRKTITLIAIFLFYSSFSRAGQQNTQQALKITFPAADALIVTADLYYISDSLPYMILCHQAGYSRGEYMETAKKFCQLGFNCIAIDQRSGKEVNGVFNETAALAIKREKPTTYLDAETDIIAAINYAYAESGKKVVLVGSSYSASLALKIAASNKKVSAVLAFSPGEYFGKAMTLKDSITNLSVPVFVTSSQTEATDVSELMKDIRSKINVQFIPISEGKHGSSCLWKNNPSRQEYWMAIMIFVRRLK